MRQFIKKSCFYFIILIIILATSCSDLLIGPDPENSPIQNFELLWREFDHFYSLFEHKNTNWDSLYNVYRPQISDNISENRLFEIISEMLANLRDGHVSLYTPFANYSYTEWREKFTIYFDLETVKSRYLANTFKFAGAKNILFGKVTDEIGYIHIISFNSERLKEKHFEEIDEALESLKGCKGMIVDVRENGGGNSRFADIVAGRFADKKRLASYIRYRNGPKHNDFTDFIPQFIIPEGAVHFVKPIVLLVNRKSFSATEYFSYAMKALPYVTVIGDTTGGGLGFPITRELPNGWIYRLPRSVQLSPDSINYEGIGIAPDIYVLNTQSDKIFATDAQLAKAITHLQQVIN